MKDFSSEFIEWFEFIAEWLALVELHVIIITAVLGLVSLYFLIKSFKRAGREALRMVGYAMLFQVLLMGFTIYLLFDWVTFAKGVFSVSGGIKFTNPAKLFSSKIAGTLMSTLVNGFFFPIGILRVFLGFRESSEVAEPDLPEYDPDAAPAEDMDSADDDKLDS